MMLIAASDFKNSEISVDKIILRRCKDAGAMLSLPDMSPHVERNEFRIIGGPPALRQAG